METFYRKLYLKDLKKLKNQKVYSKIYKLSFETIPKARNIEEIPKLKAMKNYPERYRIRVGGVSNRNRGPKR